MQPTCEAHDASRSSMSDDERDFGGSTAPDDEELSLPKATIQKLIQDYLPSDMSCAKDTRDLLIECCVEFIHLVSSEANEACEKDSKKTIAPDHVVKALIDLGFEKYTREVQDVLNDHKQHQKVRVFSDAGTRTQSIPLRAIWTIGRGAAAPAGAALCRKQGAFRRGELAIAAAVGHGRRIS